MTESAYEADVLVAVAWQMDTAPKDGTMLRLLVDYTGVEHWTPLDDEMQAWTIGYNTLADQGEDEWIIAGWDWEQDCFVTGNGKVIGWLPFHDAAQSARDDAMRAEGRAAEGDLLYNAWLGLRVLSNIATIKGLSGAADVTTSLLAEIEAAHPEFAPRSALRSSAFSSAALLDPAPAQGVPA